MSQVNNLSLYIHIPWCVKKCPYCDFNSHGLDNNPTGSQIPEDEYVQRLLDDLSFDLKFFDLSASKRCIQSIFFGGGTPSLFQASSIKKILDGVNQQISIDTDCETTLEANPGTFEAEKFLGFRQAGVNRLSIGIQSFNNQQLKRLGRIHNAEEARQAVDMAFTAGFVNVNLDLMYALPEQSLDEALYDVETALSFPINHLSHYQLTLEPNTLFAKYPPALPNDDDAWQIQEACQELINNKGFQQYEVSAYAREGQRSRHNLNYWRFGDYLGVGAGAHGKIMSADGVIRRTAKPRHPKQYLNNALDARFINVKTVAQKDLAFEFCLNRLRLYEAFSVDDFERGTGLDFESIDVIINSAQQRGWLILDKGIIQVTETGQRFMNDLQASFLP